MKLAYRASFAFMIASSHAPLQAEPTPLKDFVVPELRKGMWSTVLRVDEEGKPTYRIGDDDMASCQNPADALRKMLDNADRWNCSITLLSERGARRDYEQVCPGAGFAPAKPDQDNKVRLRMSIESSTPQALRITTTYPGMRSVAEGRWLRDCDTPEATGPITKRGEFPALQLEKGRWQVTTIEQYGNEKARRQDESPSCTDPVEAMHEGTGMEHCRVKVLDQTADRIVYVQACVPSGHGMPRDPDGVSRLKVELERKSPDHFTMTKAVAGGRFVADAKRLGDCAPGEQTK